MTLLLLCLHDVAATLAMIVVNYNAIHKPIFYIMHWGFAKGFGFVRNIWFESDALMFTVAPLHNSLLYSKLQMICAVRSEEIETSQYLGHCENTIFCFQKQSKLTTHKHTHKPAYTYIAYLILCLPSALRWPKCTSRESSHGKLCTNQGHPEVWIDANPCVSLKRIFWNICIVNKSH